jgi:hypothetical protein
MQCEREQHHRYEEEEEEMNLQLFRSTQSTIDNEEAQSMLLG